MVTFLLSCKITWKKTLGTSFLEVLKNPTIPKRGNRKISRNEYITNFE